MNSSYPKQKSPKAVVLLSGGLDSATVLAIAKAQGYECYALSINYGQRHMAELNAAKTIARLNNVVEHKTLDIDLSGIGGSALTDTAIDVPESPSTGIPITYVPARNTIMLSLALGWAEVVGASAIFAGMNAVDYSGYPDCRPAFVNSFETLANLATKAGVEGHKLHIKAPLIDLSKAEIIQQGIKLGVDYSLTVSCYQADSAGRACGLCDSCRLRQQGFAEAKRPDPTLYRA